MITSTDSGPLTDRDWVRLNDQCEALERAWRKAEDDFVDLGRFLPPAEDPLRRRCLLELIKTDLEIRWRRNLPITLDNYLARFRELGPIDALPGSLIYEEYRTRHLHGDRPKLGTYRDRFSAAQFEELQQLLDEDPLTVQDSTLRPPSRDDELGGPRTPSSPAQGLPPSGPEPVGDPIIPSEGYTLGPEIGSGQFGVVFRATAPGGIPVAVKRIIRPLSDDICKRELRALELLSHLRHPALLSIHTYWPRQHRLVIVMELADDSLADRLQECKKAGRKGIPPDELIAYFREAAEALDYLHSQNLMHRDIKPANLLRVKGHAKVADFGLVRLQAQSLDATLPGGTPLYMAPECFRGQVSVHSDQYSLAVTYAEMRLGRRIFRAKNMPDLALEHDKGAPDLHDLDGAERKVLLRALSKKPDDRYPSCREFVHALSRVADKSLEGPINNTLLSSENGADQADPEPGVERVAPDAACLSASRKGDVGRAWQPQAPAKRRRRLLGAGTVALFGLLIAGGVVPWLGFPRDSGSLLTNSSSSSSVPPPSSFTLHKLGALILHPDESKRLPLTINRKEFAGVVRIAVSEAAGLHFVPDYLVTTADHGTLEITVEPTAALGLRRVTVTTTAEGQPAQTMPFSLLVLPAGYTTDDQFETSYPPRIVRSVEAEGKKFEVVCVLLHPKGGSGAPCYLMENKVCNGVFRVFSQQDGAKLGNSLWRRGGVANGRDLGVENDFLPVLRVTRSEAERCALWLGGRLPSARQLDEAAGLHERPTGRAGPARGPAVAVNRAAEGPQPINTDSDDISLYGIRDLAGNGREWTRDRMPLPDGTQVAILRGRSYTASGPLRFRDLEEWNKSEVLCPTQFPEHASPYTGFRVVIELPGEQTLVDHPKNG